jgi:hypothetical protein
MMGATGGSKLESPNSGPEGKMDAMTDFLSITISEFEKLKQMAEKALAQIDDRAFFHAPDPESNSLAIVIKHVGGNLRSRWTDFLTTDGEKPDRDRDGEFEVRPGDSRVALMQKWEEGWGRVLGTLRGLTALDLEKTVQIRGKAWIVEAAIQSALSHTAQHVGQIVYLAKHLSGKDWSTLSIPRAQSAQYNRTVQEQARADAKR